MYFLHPNQTGDFSDTHCSFASALLQQMVCYKETQDKCLISLFNHIGIETGNRKELESISRIRIGIDQIQTIPNPTVVVYLLSIEGRKTLRFHQKYLNLFSEDEQRSYAGLSSATNLVCTHKIVLILIFI